MTMLDPWSGIHIEPTQLGHPLDSKHSRKIASVPCFFVLFHIRIEIAEPAYPLRDSNDHLSGPSQAQQPSIYVLRSRKGLHCRNRLAKPLLTHHQQHRKRSWRVGMNDEASLSLLLEQQGMWQIWYGVEQHHDLKAHVWPWKQKQLSLSRGLVSNYASFHLISKNKLEHPAEKPMCL